MIRKLLCRHFGLVDRDRLDELHGQWIRHGERTTDTMRRLERSIDMMAGHLSRAIDDLNAARKENRSLVFKLLTYDTVPIELIGRVLERLRKSPSDVVGAMVDLENGKKILLDVKTEATL